MNLNFDKLKNLNRDNEGKKGFDINCPKCNAGSESLHPSPINISYKPYEFINGSIFPMINKDLHGVLFFDVDIGRKLDRLPTIRDALLDSKKEDILLECDRCDTCSRVPDDILYEDLRRFIKVCYNEGTRY